MELPEAYRPDPRFAALGPDFADAVVPADFPMAQLRFWNHRWAQEMGLDGLGEADRKRHFHNFDPLPDNQAAPLAIRYHGHQFRTYNPEIGDGRGFLHAQARDSRDRLLDFATKGSGQTPFSRTGDGRLTLKGAVREILAAEMLEALGVYTSKIFSVYETGEPLHRGDEPSPTRSAVLTRLSHSHVRFGAFQRHAYFNRADLVGELAAYAADALVPEAGEHPDGLAAGVMDAACRRSAALAAQWMAAGFVHGVLNTDNLVVTGESFDYGPWRFLPYFEPGFTAAYFDHSGLYAYARQPESVFWALQQLGGALSLIGEREALIDALTAFPDHYKREVRAAFLNRLGLEPLDEEGDGAFVTAFLDAMKSTRLPWEAVFFDWFCGDEARALDSARGETYRSEAFAPVREAIAARAPVRPERLSHLYFRRANPVHLVIETVEDIWRPIAEDDDWSALEGCLADIASARTGYDLGRGRDGFLDG
ncbi:YdiU family protein [Alkalicaulis satelles]|uniref:Protein nucleotidyltransferase YdiU n=1 Tax=Alkalicaulis satelles TaxID=2609175 RepID=A0A5M6ZGJ7_9PROT|nr:YdiU family protein [Alkalicaulis satelles]KAA5802248.1 YdiU family protein [Alkalicaulis satelles]